MTQLATAEKIENRTTELTTSARPFEDSVNHLQVVDEPTLGQAGDLMSELRSRRDAVEKDRKEMKAPVLQIGKMIDSRYKQVLGFYDGLIGSVRKEMNGYIADREKKRREEEAAAKKLLEDAALARAEAEAKAGHEDTADAIIDGAVALDIVAPAAPAYGESSTVGTTTRITADVSDQKALLEAVVSGQVPVDLVTINKTALRKWARDIMKQSTGDTQHVHGVDIKRVKEAVVR